MATRLALVGVVTIVSGLLAAGLWVIGQARYLEDYCHTRVPTPGQATGGRPAYLDGLVTIRCEYDGVPDVAITDALPLVGGVLLAAAVLVVAAVVFHWARRPAG